MIRRTNYCIWIIIFSFLIVEKGEAINNDTISKKENFKFSRIVFSGNGYCGVDVHLNKSLKDSTGMESTSLPIGLAPIILWKLTPQLFIESEFDFMMDHGMLSGEIGYANLCYSTNKLGTIQIGKFLSPFGIYSERYHPFWINNAPNTPLGFAHEGSSPESELGVCYKVGSKHFTYAMYASLSPKIDGGSENVKNAGKIIFHIDLREKFNKKIGLGARVGILPFKNPSIELGLSYKWMQLEVGEHYDGTAVTHTHPSGEQSKYYIGNMYAVDLTIEKILARLKGKIDIKAQVNYTDVGTNNFIKTSPSGITEIDYSYSNKSEIGFAMLSFKPILVDNYILKRSGIFVRGGTLQLPIGSLWYETTYEITAGLNYSFNWQNILKIGYQQISTAKKGYTNNILLQWAVGF